jgi:hypothetical protein
MRPVSLADILDIAQYEKQRPGLRPRYLELKARRRMSVGPHLTLLWENRDTAWYQIEEMMRIERIDDEEAIRHEIDTYNDLVPGDGELKATMLLELPEPAERDAKLRALTGLERCVHLRVGDAHDVRAGFDARQMNAEKLSSVQFVTFALGGDARSALLAGASAEMVITHPAYRASAPLGPGLLAELKADLLAP